MLHAYLAIAAAHDLRLILVAAVICVFASFTALATFEQARQRRLSRPLWVGLAAIVAGVGIWTTHFLAMLAYHPGVPIGYDLTLTLLSVAFAILLSACGWTVALNRNSAAPVMAGGLMGAGISLMHYVGMSAMAVAGHVRYDRKLVIASIALSMTLSAAALVLNRRSDRRPSWAAAILLTLAICGMHFTGMAAAVIHLDHGMAAHVDLANSVAMKIAVSAAALLILLISFGLVLLDRRAARRQLREAKERAALAEQVLKGAAERERLAAEVKRQADISSAALSNIVQGLSMYDDDDRLVIWNERYAELYGIPDRLLVERTPHMAIIGHCISSGNFAGSLDFFKDEARLAKVDSISSEFQLSDGRIIKVQRRPVPDGGWVATHEDVTEVRQATNRIAYLARHDVLTGLPNRAAFGEALTTASDHVGDGHGFAVLTIDLDRFKEVNDTLGHPVGDHILREVSVRLCSLAGDDDIVTRMGGDEFAVLQRSIAERSDAEALAANIVAALGEPYHLDGHTVAIGASVGISFAPDHGTNADELLKLSDLALYRAKSDSRGTYRFFECGMDRRLRERRKLETDLALAVQHGQFELHYQPQLDLASGAINGFEALVRWNHPARGIIQPADFIAVAEESGLIIPIGEWVLRQACRNAAAWPSDIRVSVNLSPAQFKRGDLLSMTRSALNAAGLEPSRLELEITESVLLNDEEWVRSVLQQLTDMGVTIAMDDFGTGYSSLSYLRTFPFAKIKIDRSFVADVAEAADSLAIVQATINLSQKLGMKTTAEGVETIEQMQMLAAEGCTEIQGFHVSPAVPADEVLGLLGLYQGSEDKLRAAG
jgi:diguanylate cyclase (GGDEF)-like protein